MINSGIHTVVQQSIVFDGLDLEVRMKVLTMNGREILSNTILVEPSSSFELDISQFSDGLYFLMVETDKEVFIRKFVKTVR